MKMIVRNKENLGEGRNKVFIFVPILVLVAILIAYFYGWNIGAYLHPDRTAYSMSELTAMVNDDIDSGKEKGTFYISGISSEDIASINDYVCSVNGDVEQYSVLEKGRNGMKVSFRYEISDNFYVMDKYLNGKEIPADRPSARQLYDKVVEIVNQIITPDMTDYEKELAIHDYIVLNCKYGYVDYSKEYAYSAYGCLVQNTAVCNGYAEAMAILLSCEGIENQIICGTAGDELHAWNQVKINNQWYHVDATWNDPVPDMVGVVTHAYFNVPDDILSDTHTWDKEMYETCTSMDGNYYVYNNLDGYYDDFINIVRQAAAKDITATVETLVYDYSSSYNLDAIFDISGITHLWYTELKYGDGHILTIYLNQSQ